MPVPDFQTLMLPLLQCVRDGRTYAMSEVRDTLARELRLSDADRHELLPSGRQRRFDNRVAWARVHLGGAELVESPRRGHVRITDAGRALLTESPARIDMRLLDRYPPYRRFRQRPGHGTEGPPSTGAEAVETPEEVLERSYQAIRAEIAAELLARVRLCTPGFFEQLVVELLLKMGYGRSRAEAGRAIGASGDEGIDGIISEDRLGLDNIYIQAKRWEGTVGRPEIQKFVGALHGKRARKGVFITTGAYSAEAREFVSHIESRVVLIDGRELAEYMLDYGLGVTTRATYELKRIDSDYFAED